MGFDRFVSSIPVNFQWQYLIAGVVLLLLAALLRFRIGMIMGCVLVLFQVPAFWPYFVGGSHSSEVANLRVTVANVQGANRQTGRVGAWIREMDADVVLLQETNDHWNEYLPRLHDHIPIIARCVAPNNGASMPPSLASIPSSSMKRFWLGQTICPYNAQ